MSTTGTGRGRGWLHLNKSETTRPGSTQSSPRSDQSEVKVQIVEEVKCDSTKVNALIALIQQLDPADDGILLNKKLSNIIKLLKKVCENSQEVKDVLCSVYGKCKEDASLATKLVIMISSQTACKEFIHDVKIRNPFITYMQQDFENSKEIQATNPTSFCLCVKILGDFYHKARYSDGRVIKFLAIPLLHYFDLLLDIAQTPELEIFTTQLYLNGAAIKSEYSEKLQEILLKVRHILVTKSDLSQTCRVWLLLALDAENYRFSLFPSELQKFYHNQLGDEAIAQFQGTHCTLSIQTAYANKTLDSFQSNVNVLQVTPPESTSPVDPGQQELVYNNYGSATSETWEPAPKEKVGRPILGAGARLQRNNYEALKQGPSQGMDTNTGWDNKYKTTNCAGWSDKPNTQTPNEQNWNNRKNNKSKGWEHDDRFENDYAFN